MGHILTNALLKAFQWLCVKLFKRFILWCKVLLCLCVYSEEEEDETLMCGNQGCSLYHQQIAEELNTLWVINNVVLHKVEAIYHAVSTIVWNLKTIAYWLNIWVFFKKTNAILCPLPDTIWTSFYLCVYNQSKLFKILLAIRNLVLLYVQISLKTKCGMKLKNKECFIEFPGQILLRCLPKVVNCNVKILETDNTIEMLAMQLGNISISSALRWRDLIHPD